MRITSFFTVYHIFRIWATEIGKRFDFFTSGFYNEYGEN